jgi:uncharacterized membrane protein YidH (DUF202 family)
VSGCARIRSGVGSVRDVAGEGPTNPQGPRAPEAAEEREPDARFTYANERTFLAWNRTALALIATGVAATQLLPKLQVEWGRRLLGLPLIALGAVVAIGIVVIGAIAVVVSALGTT